jgi:hypothetical protein
MLISSFKKRKSHSIHFLLPLMSIPINPTFPTHKKSRRQVLAFNNAMCAAVVILDITPTVFAHSIPLLHVPQHFPFNHASSLFQIQPNTHLTQISLLRRARLNPQVLLPFKILVVGDLVLAQLQQVLAQVFGPRIINGINVARAWNPRLITNLPQHHWNNVQLQSVKELLGYVPVT